jgi:hypothetical protein
MAAADRFPFTSRYHGLEVGEWTDAAGTPHKYVRRRFIPPPDRFELIVEHTVRQGDRVDTIAAEALGDPEQFWRLCDANGVMRPEELTETIGSRIRITMPEGIPGGSRNA